jgi:hypothetical protein
MPLNQGAFISSGAGWGLAYAGLLLAILRTSGTLPTGARALDALLIAPGIGAGALALASMRYQPTTAQAGVGAAVLVLSGLVLGFTVPTPYILSMLSSVGAITAVSVLWEEAAERPSVLFRDREKGRPYRTVWW